MDVPTCEATLQAIHVLYGVANAQEKESAAKWLEHLQKSVYAWQIADELLLRRVDHESCYFAAQTMRTKIQRSFQELPQSSYISLRDSLMNQLSLSWSPVILTQLGLAAVDLALLMPPWQTPVKDIITRFGTSTDASSKYTLLELLTLFPEEVEPMRVGQNRRAEIIAMLQDSNRGVLQTLVESLHHHQNDGRVVCQVFRCMRSWLEAGVLPPEDPILLNVLLPKAFEVLMDLNANRSLQDAALEAVTQAIIVAEDTEKYHQLAVFCSTKVYLLHDVYVQAVNSEDAERPNIYCRIFTDLGESLLRDIIATPGRGLGDARTLDLILLCAQHYDYEVAEITFNFWNKFSTQLYDTNDRQLQEFFKPYVLVLIGALCHHCQLDADREGLPDKEDDFVEFRERCSDLVKDVIFVVGSHDCFEKLRSRLGDADVQNAWNVTEATMFVMCSIARNLNPDETLLVAPVVEAILAMLDTCHISVRHTAIRLLGELAEWLAKHPQYIVSVFNSIMHALRTPLASVAAVTLEKLCSHCSEHLKAHRKSLMEIVISMDHNSMTCQDATVQLFQGVTNILGENQDYARLQELVDAQLKPINEMLRNPNHQIVARNPKSDPSVWADRLTVIFQQLFRNKHRSGPAPLPMAQKSWVTLDGVMQRWKENSKIMEKTCRTIRYLVRWLSTDASPLLEPLANRLISTYNAHPHSCFLYLNSILVDEFGSQKSCVPGLISLVNAFAEPTFVILNSPEALEQNPDTVEDFFRLCSRCVQRAPLEFMTSAGFRGILECAMACASLAHREANTVVMRFLTEFLTCADDASPDDKQIRLGILTSILVEMGPALVHSLLHAVVTKLPTYLCSDVGEVLFELRNHTIRIDFDTWLKQAAMSLPMVGAGGTVTVTPNQLGSFLHEMSIAQESKQIRSALRDLARLYI